MITSFEVGAVFKIINQASPALTKILAQIRELNLAIDNPMLRVEQIPSVKATPAEVLSEPGDMWIWTTPRCLCCSSCGKRISAFLRAFRTGLTSTYR